MRVRLLRPVRTVAHLSEWQLNIREFAAALLLSRPTTCHGMWREGGHATIEEGGGYNFDRHCGERFRGTSGAQHRKSNQRFSFHASSIIVFVQTRQHEI
jgi:hypothetical protein